MILALIVSSKNILKLFIIIIGLTIVFITSQFLLIDSYEYHFVSEILTGNIYFFNRYLYIFIFILFFDNIKIRDKTWQKLFLYFEYFLFVNAIAIVLGILFNIELFRSYEFSERFGYSGLFSNPGEASYIYIIVIVANYFLWIVNERYINRNKLIFFILFSLCLGQKKVLLFLILLLLLHLLFVTKYRKTFRIVLLPLGIMIYVCWNYIFALGLELFPFWKRIYFDRGILSVITSDRNLLLEDAIIYIRSNWNFLNYIFGGLDFNKFKVEFELVDLYLFFGVFGIGFYVYILKRFISDSDYLKTGLILIVFLTSFVSGGLILNVTAIIGFYFIIKRIMLNDKQKINGYN